MVVKAVVEWQGPAGFDDDVAITVVPGARRHEVVRPRLHRDQPRRARVHGHDHVRVGVPGTHDSVAIPEVCVQR